MDAHFIEISFLHNTFKQALSHFLDRHFLRMLESIGIKAFGSGCFGKSRMTNCCSRPMIGKHQNGHSVFSEVDPMGGGKVRY